MTKSAKTILGILYNDSENRPRVLWRLLIELILGLAGIGLINLLALFVITILLLVTLQIPFGVIGDGQAFSLAINAAFARLPILAGLRSLINLVFIGFAFYFLARWIDRRSFRDYGFHFNAVWWRDLAAGLVLGAILIGGIFVVERLFGWVSIQGTFLNDKPELPFWQLLVDGFFGFVLVGVEEELFSRGYQIKNLAEGLHSPRISPKAAVLLAYLLTSVLFGFLHSGKENASLVSSLNLILGGLFLGSGFLLTGELALPIGLHITWNFVQGYIFGFPVSGVKESITLLATQQTGPVAWTGGAFGPEGGLLGIVAFLVGILLILVWVRLTRNRVSIQFSLAQYLSPEQEQKDYEHQETGMLAHSHQAR